MKKKVTKSEIERKGETNSESADIKLCPFCGQEMECDWTSCPYCGNSLVCPRCGKEIEKEWVTCPYCKTRLDGKTKEEQKFSFQIPKLSYILGLISALLIFIGSFLPWASVTSVFVAVSKSGLEGDGIITLFLALIIFAVLYLSYVRSKRRKLGAVAIIILNFLVLVIGIVDAIDIAEMTVDSEYAFIDIGEGLVLIIIGSLIGIVAGLGIFRIKKAEPDMPKKELARKTRQPNKKASMSSVEKTVRGENSTDTAPIYVSTDNDDVNKLINDIYQGNYRERIDSIKALGALGDNTAVKPLLDIVTKRPRDESTVPLILQALVEIGDSSAIEPLTDIRKNTSKYLDKNFAETIQLLSSAKKPQKSRKEKKYKISCPQCNSEIKVNESVKKLKCPECGYELEFA